MTHIDTKFWGDYYVQTPEWEEFFRLFGFWYEVDSQVKLRLIVNNGDVFDNAMRSSWLEPFRINANFQVDRLDGFIWNGVLIDELTGMLWYLGNILVLRAKKRVDRWHIDRLQPRMRDDGGDQFRRKCRRRRTARHLQSVNRMLLFCPKRGDVANGCCAAK